MFILLKDAERIIGDLIELNIYVLEVVQVLFEELLSLNLVAKLVVNCLFYFVDVVILDHQNLLVIFTLVKFLDFKVFQLYEGPVDML